MTADSGGAAAEPNGLVLVIEDESSIADLQRLYLSRAGFGVRVFTTGRDGLSAVRSLRPVAVVLDIRLPDLDGVEVCRTLRSEGDSTPVLFVTARDEETDRIVGLEIGADDYIVKPFSPRELVARVKAVLRRGHTPQAQVLDLGQVRVDLAARRVTAAGEEIELTPTEFELLAYLARHAGQVLSREKLLAAVWGYAAMGTRTVDVHIAQLRGKLGSASPLRTARGAGYAAERT